MRRVVLLTALAALISVLALIRLLLSPTSSLLPSYLFSSLSPTTPTRPKPGPPPSEQYASLSRGRWRPRPIKDEQDLEARFGPLGPTCSLPPEAREGLTEEEKVLRATERKMSVSSWEWVPERGRMKEWDTLRVLRRLLNSERGLILVGDSITGQMAAALHSLLLIPPPTSSPFPNAPTLILTTSHRTGPPHHALTRLSLHLNPSHPLTQFLRLSLPHVPASRFSEPVAQFLRHDLLLSFRDLESIFRSLNISGWVGESAGFFAQHPWLSSLPSPEDISRAWEGEEDSILLLNTGAHWTPDRFYMPGGEYVRGHRGMVRVLAPHLLGLPRLHVIYRSISPPHTACQSFSEPVYPAPALDPARANPSYGWTRFPELDEIWKRQLDELAPRGIGAGGGRVAYLDVSEMAGQRPDGHLLAGGGEGEGEGGADCMHWCGMGVVAGWVGMLWEGVEQG